jgi:hypothetical protein
MEKRGLDCPDDGDALALTFAHSVLPPVNQLDEDEDEYGNSFPGPGNWMARRVFLALLDQSKRIKMADPNETEAGDHLTDENLIEGAFASAYCPSVPLKYSTIAFTSPSDAWAPRATMFCTTAFQPAASIRWLVTTSTA